MRSRFQTSLVVTLSSLLVVLLLGAGCKDKLDTAKYTTQAASLAQKYTPQLQELSAKLPELAKRAGDIPDSVPGASALKGLLAKNQGVVTQLQGVIAGLTAKVAEQAKAGKPDEVKKLLDTTTAELDTGIAAAQADVNAATAELAKVEEAAKAAPPAPADPAAPAAPDAAPAAPADAAKPADAAAAPPAGKDK